MSAVPEWHTMLEELLSADPTLGPTAYFDQVSKRFPEVTKHQVKHKVKRIREKGAKQEHTREVPKAAEQEQPPVGPRSPAEAVTGPGFLFYGDPLSDHGRAETPIPLEQCVLPETAYEMRSSPIGGYGIFAKQEILAGDYIMLEEAVISIKLPEVDKPTRKQMVPDLEEAANEAFRRLKEKSPEVAEDMMKLQDCFGSQEKGTKSPAGILLTNAIPGKDGEHALCLRISRFNHSCSPNAHYMHDPGRDRLFVRSQRNIAVGEEICVHYFEFGPEIEGVLSATALLPCKKRKERMRISFESECKCQVCGADATAVARSDGRRQGIRRAFITLAGRLQGTEERIAYNALRLAQEEGLAFPTLVRQFSEVGWSISRRVPGHQRQVFWYRIMYEVFRFCFGEWGKAAPGYKRDAIEAAAAAAAAAGSRKGKQTRGS